MFFFFFSSRRRHTRLQGDWSSDVCSSDLITGGALVDSLRGKTFDKICNQNDLPATILKQLQLPHSNFVWSKNIFNEGAKEFAYYSNENALGRITPQQNIVYSLNSHSIETLQPKTQTKLNDT